MAHILETQQGLLMESQSNNTTFYSQGYQTDSIIKMRLDTNDIIERLAQYLSGKKMMPKQNSDGSITLQSQQIGTPLANDEGVQSLCSFVQGIVNPAVVQGNLTPEQYDNFVYRIDISLTEQLVINSKSWGIAKQKRTTVKNFIMPLIESFLTRLIGNKERESYGETIRSMERSHVENDKKFKLFGRGEQ